MTSPDSQIELYLERAKVLSSMDDPIDILLQNDDYTVSSFTKAGTTWVQQIVHQIRSGGDESFEEISLAIPYLMPEAVFGEQLGDKNRNIHRPRVFKTHLNYEDLVPQGGKHIYVMRNPEDTLWSNLHFLPSIVCTPNISIEDFYFRFYRDRENPNYWRHILSWWTHRDETEKLLLLHFEDLKENPEHCIRHMAKFLNVPLSDEILKIILHRSSYSYMQEHSHMFDGRFEVGKVREVLGLTDGQKSLEKVRAGGGEVGQGKKNIPEIVKEDLRRVWKEKIESKTGCKNYEEFRSKSSLLNRPL